MGKWHKDSRTKLHIQNCIISVFPLVRKVAITTYTHLVNKLYFTFRIKINVLQFGALNRKLRDARKMILHSGYNVGNL